MSFMRRKKEKSDSTVATPRKTEAIPPHNSKSERIKLGIPACESLTGFLNFNKTIISSEQLLGRTYLSAQRWNPGISQSLAGNSKWKDTNWWVAAQNCLPVVRISSWGATERGDWSVVMFFVALSDHRGQTRQGGEIYLWKSLTRCTVYLATTTSLVDQGRLFRPMKWDCRFSGVKPQALQEQCWRNEIKRTTYYNSVALLYWYGSNNTWIRLSRYRRCSATGIVTYDPSSRALSLLGSARTSSSWRAQNW